VTGREEDKRQALLWQLHLIIISAIIELLNKDTQNSGLLFVIYFIINYFGLLVYKFVILL
jgi:hypothetical protein